MCFWIREIRSSWETWTCLRLHRKVFASLRLGHHTMLVHRFGRINLMIKNLISGPWVLSSTSSFAWKFRSRVKIWRLCSRKSPEESMPEFLQNIQVNWVEWSDRCFRSILNIDPPVTKSWRCQLLWKELMTQERISKLNYFELSKVITSIPLENNFQRLITKQRGNTGYRRQLWSFRRSQRWKCWQKWRVCRCWTKIRRFTRCRTPIGSWVVTNSTCRWQIETEKNQKWATVVQVLTQTTWTQS